MRKILAVTIIYGLGLFLFNASAWAQKSATQKSKRKRAKVSRPADFDGAGLLQTEYGYDGNFKARDVRRDQTGTASLIFNVTDDLQFEVDFDAWQNTKDPPGRNATGIGDFYWNTQYTVIDEKNKRPALALAYNLKLGTASADNGLGTGKADHKLTGLLSRKYGVIGADFSVSLLVNGRQSAPGFATGTQVAFGLSRELHKRWSWDGEIFGETLDTDQPQGLFAQAGLTYQINARANVDVGARIGLSAAAPRAGFFGGFTVDFANFYKRH